MTKTEYSKYLQGPEWQAKRREAIKYAGDKCERCELPRWLAEIAYDQDLNVHHLTYANKGNEQPEDLEVLCRRCHEVETYSRSELREVKRAKCEGCFDTHWNYRSSYCGACIELRQQFDKVMWRMDQEVEGDKVPLWLQAVHSVVFSLVNEGHAPKGIKKILGEEIFVHAQLYTKQLAADKDIPF